MANKYLNEMSSKFSVLRNNNNCYQKWPAASVGVASVNHCCPWWPPSAAAAGRRVSGTAFGARLMNRLGSM